MGKQFKSFEDSYRKSSKARDDSSLVIRMSVCERRECVCVCYVWGRRGRRQAVFESIMQICHKIKYVFLISFQVAQFKVGP